MRFGEESLGPDPGLMSYWKRAFASSLLPECCEFKAQAEPKRNIICVLEHDFSSKFLQAGL
jgi:hypothetical protein